MNKTCYGRFGAIFFVAAALTLLFVTPLHADPDPCLVVYPQGPCVYHYDVNEYYVVTMGHMLYDPLYDRGGEVLLDINTNMVDLSIYQAPNLIGFQPSTGGQEGYFVIGYDLDLIIDGWNEDPITYSNILVVFVPDPPGCMPIITVEGNPVSGPPYTYSVGDLVVSTPVHNHYSDTMMKHIEWGGCYGLNMWAFADENYNGVHDAGEECFSAFSHDVTIPTENRTWGEIKSLYE